MGQPIHFITMFHCSLWPNFYYHSVMHMAGQLGVNFVYLIFPLSIFSHTSEKKLVAIPGGLTNHPYVRKSTRDTPLALSNNVKSVLFLVPKFHLPAHVEACNLQFSFNLTKGVGRTDGEAPERGWANINPAAQSTKEMGPGSRRDTLDDHFGDWNWKKMIKLGKVFFRLHAPGQPLTLYVW